MEQIIMLGAGHGGTLDLYNTCFDIRNDIGDFLVDTGGSIEIVRRLKNINIDIKALKHIFISHSHTDHILGLIWYFKRIGRLAVNGEMSEKINIYCNDVVYTAIIRSI
jgi:ribonuclease Z